MKSVIDSGALQQSSYTNSFLNLCVIFVLYYIMFVLIFCARLRLLQSLYLNNELVETV